MRKLNLLFFIVVIFLGCKKEKTLFMLLDAQQTGIDFDNKITENDTLSILSSEFIYNGGGVAAGDLNGDGLQDLFFTGNQVQNKLYLNKGNFFFEDISEKAHVQKQRGEWSAGINLLDINRDGKLDIYVCNTFLKESQKRQNLLYINQGNAPEGYPIFKEMANNYGIADTTHSANAQFFDYDNDGDLDLFIGVNYMDTPYPNQYLQNRADGTSPNKDMLYKNDWNNEKGHPVFTDVSLKAGIKWEGYSHSSLICDFNDDGWQDIYVANDYLTNDLVYINQKDGTFKNEITTIFKHQASSAMGSDVADMNNDGLLDIFTTEMLPYYNKRKKLFLNANNYTTYINNESYQYQYQYPRNTLQLNQGLNPETGYAVFSDVSFLSNVQETEWSWTPLLADFDNDGNRDIFVTNGFPRDVTDHDFGAFRSVASNLVSKMELQKMIPQVKVPKFIFKNEGKLSFKDQSKEWGVVVPAFSNGAIYGDLDNDGDLDIVVNNINDKAFVFKNTLNDNNKKSSFLRVKIEGNTENPDAFGTKVVAFFNKKKQAAQTISGRGYLSCAENIVHFGLGDATIVDSIIIYEQGKSSVMLTNLAVNQTHIVRLKDLKKTVIPPFSQSLFFKNIEAKTLGLDFVSQEMDYIDFNIQRTLPHKYSQYNPSIAVGDVNGDGREDFMLGGGSQMEETWFLQQKNGSFTQKKALYKKSELKKEEDAGALLFDADDDGDLDLYLVRGGGQAEINSPLYQDVLCVNDGKGNFSIASGALPLIQSNGSAIKAADFDGDGDLDLFRSSRVMAKNYPKSDRSFLLRNDSEKSKTPVFTDITAQICPELANIGLISDALWTDFNNDHLPDLILAGEWMPLTFFENKGGKLLNITKNTGISDKIGWWNSLLGGDFDNDGDIDYVAGNFGKNIYFQCSSDEPLRVYAKDFDNNGLYDPFISCYWRDSLGKKHEYFYHTRDDMIKQLTLIRAKFKTYSAFGMATVQDVFSKEELAGAQVLAANWLESGFVENLGNNQFKLSALPIEAQFAPIYGLLSYDYDADGLLDLMMVGNDYGMELIQGRADAFNGLVLKNTGKNTFTPISLAQSGFVVPHDARAMARITTQNSSKNLILATQYKGTLKVFAPEKTLKKTILAQKGEAKAIVSLKNGQQRLMEFYWGHSFLAQTSRSLSFDESIRKVIFYNQKGMATRTIE